MNEIAISRPCASGLPEGEFDLLEVRLPWHGDAEKVFLACFSSRDMSFWLDSNMIIDGLSRYSFMGAQIGPHARLITYDVHDETVTVIGRENTSPLHTHVDLFRFISDSMERITVRTPQDYSHPFAGGICGYFGYELKANTCRGHAFRSDSPDAALIFVDRFLAFDHQEGTISICALARHSDVCDRQRAEAWINEMQTKIGSIEPDTVPMDLSDERSQKCNPVFHLRDGQESYIEKIEQSLASIREGETYEVCLTNQITTRSDVAPLDIYRVLRRANPLPYSAYLKFGDLAVSCSSPERFLRVDQNRVAESKPIKGTAKRSSDPKVDKEIANELARDEKSRSENLMIVDLLRNDLGRVCRTGSVHVPKLMQVETYETVHQLVSTVRGELDESVSAVDCVRACFPGGSMTGAPKVRTMEIIDQLERTARGIYSGSIGYLSLCGECDLNIVIRTIVSQDGNHSIGCGGAIVALSDPQEEYNEILLVRDQRLWD